MRWERQKIDCDEGTLPGLSLSELAPVPGPCVPFRYRALVVSHFTRRWLRVSSIRFLRHQGCPFAGALIDIVVAGMPVYCSAHDSQIVVRTNVAEVLAWQHLFSMRLFTCVNT